MKPNTKDRILKYSEQLMLSNGYNGFSFMDIAKKIEIKKASIHYHFPSKQDLGVAIVQKYSALFSRWKKNQSEKSLIGKIDSFFSMYHSLYRNGKQICPIGMLLAEYTTIPPMLQQSVKTLFEEEKTWLTKNLQKALVSKTIPDTINPDVFTDLILSYLSGAIKFWRFYKDDSSYYAAKTYFLNQLSK